ncbi:MAG TPA: pyridoxine 5'-phosphate synthase [Phycisphaerales bacterium]|nr:pyridoxine 5'-phosphate synthase [Phycisphaerales bacterium]
MPLLGVNIDHVASLRQARYRAGGAADVAAPAAPPPEAEPDPVSAAHEAELGGAQIITVHLREDRRHIHDRDLVRLAERGRARLNLEMAATPAMLRLAVDLRARTGRPHMATLVPEGRREVTTEGGLDAVGRQSELRDAAARLREAGIVVSAFIDADPAQVEAAARAAFDAAELHTGPYAAAAWRAGNDQSHPELSGALAALADAGHRVRAARLRLHAGHALGYGNVTPVAALPGMAELHIGHAIVSRAVLVGLRRAVRTMLALMDRAAEQFPRPRVP